MGIVFVNSCAIPVVCGHVQSALRAESPLRSRVTLLSVFCVLIGRCNSNICAAVVTKFGRSLVRESIFGETAVIMMMTKLLGIAILLIKSTSVAILNLARSVFQAVTNDLLEREIRKVSVAYRTVLIFVELLDLSTFILALMHRKVGSLLVVCHECPLWVPARRTFTYFLELLLMFLHMN